MRRPGPAITSHRPVVRARSQSRGTSLNAGKSRQASSAAVAKLAQVLTVVPKMPWPSPDEGILGGRNWCIIPLLTVE